MRLYLVNELYVREAEGSGILDLLIIRSPPAVVREAGQVVHQSPLGRVGVGRGVPGEKYVFSQS